MIGGDVRGRIDRCKLVLSGRDLVVLGLCHDTKFPELLVQFLHIRLDTGLDRAKIMVVQFLTLGRLRSEQGTPGINQVFTLLIDLAVDEEILLFRSDSRTDRGHILIAEKAEDAHTLLVDRLHGAQERRFFIERLSPVGAEGGRDA